MRDFPITSAKQGVTRLRNKAGASKDSFYTLKNCYVTANSSVVPRPGSVLDTTLPNNMPVGWCCTYTQAGAGQVTFSPASGATLRNADGHTKIASQWGEVSLYVRSNAGGSSAEYVMAGKTAA